MTVPAMLIDTGTRRNTKPPTVGRVTFSGTLCMSGGKRNKRRRNGWEWMPKPFVDSPAFHSRFVWRSSYLLRLLRYTDDLGKHEGCTVRVTATLRPWGNDLGAELLRANVACLDTAQHVLDALQ